MKRTHARILISLLTCVAMVVAMIPEMAFAVDGKEMKISPEDVTEANIVEKTVDSTTFDLGQGESMTIFYDGNVRYEDSDGRLTDYDPSLVSISAKKTASGRSLEGYAYENSAGDSRLYIPSRICEQTPVIMEKSDYSISFSPINSHLEETSLLDTRVRIRSEKVPDLCDHMTSADINAEYSSDKSSETVTYTSTTDGIKETIVLDERPSSSEFGYVIDAGRLVLKPNEFGGISIVDSKKNEKVAGITSPFMNDATNENYSEDLEYELSRRDDGRYELIMRVSDQYLDSARYPVTIDPTVTWTGSPQEKDAYVISGSTYGNSNFYKSDIIVMPAGKNNTGTHRTYISFPDLASTVSGKSVTSARFTCYERNTGVSGQMVGVYKITGSWNLSTITWNNKPSHNTTRQARVTCTNVQNTAQTFDILSYVQGVAGGTTDRGIVLINCSSTTKYTSFKGGRGSSYKPKLVLTYYSAPTTATSASLSSEHVRDSRDCRVSYGGITADGAACNVQYAVYSHDDATGANTEYQGYSSSRTIASGSALPSLPEGCYEIFVRGVNSQGTAGGARSCGIVHVDATAPSGQFSVPESTERNPGQAMPEIFWSNVTDAHLSEIQYSIDDGEYITAGTGESGSFQIPRESFDDSGTYRINVRAVDRCGNASEVFSRNYYVALDGPEVSSIRLRAGGEYLNSDAWTNSSDVEVVFSGVRDEHGQLDESGIEYAIVQNGSNPSDDDFVPPDDLNLVEELGEYRGSFHLNESSRPSSDGQYTIVARFTDSLGNYRRKKLSYSRDTQVPTGEISVTASASGNPYEQGYRDTIILTGTVSDVAGDASQITSGIRSSSMNLYAMQGDLAATEPEAIIYRGASVSTTRSLDTTRYSNGRYMLRIEVADEAGNTATAEEIITIANPMDAPVITVQNTASGSEVSLSWESQPAQVMYRLVRIMSGEDEYENQIEIPQTVTDWTQTSSTDSILLTGLDDGTYEIHVRGIDGDGINGKERKERFIVDSEAPIALIESFEYGILYGTAEDDNLAGWKVEIREQGSNDDFIQLLSGNSRVIERQGFGFIDLSGDQYAAGHSYLLRLTVEDRCGNESTSELTVVRESDERVSRIIEPSFRIKRPEGQDYDSDRIRFGTSLSRIECTGNVPSASGMKWYVRNRLVDEDCLELEDDFSCGSGSRYDENFYFKILAVNYQSDAENPCSSRIHVNSCGDEWVLEDDGIIDMAADDLITSFRIYCDNPDARFVIEDSEGNEHSINPGETVNLTDYYDEYQQYPIVYAASIDVETHVEVLMDTIEAEYVMFSSLEDYAPVNMRTSARLNYKTGIRWEPRVAQQEWPENLAYEVYRGETEDFEPGPDNYVGRVFSYHYDEINTNYGGRYYYRIRPVGLNPEDDEAIHFGSFSQVRSATVVDSDEYLKRLGIREYWKYAQLGTPAGTAYAEKSEGNFVYQQTDVDISGNGTDMVLTRTYNSRSTEKSIFGLGWSCDFDMELLRVVENDDDTDSLVLKYGDGSIYEFTPSATDSDGNMSYVSSLGRYVSLTSTEWPQSETFTVPVLTGDDMTQDDTETIEVRYSFTLTDKNYDEYRFDGEGRLVYVGQSNGRYLIPVYDAYTGMLSCCVTNRGTRITFEYNTDRSGDPGTVSRISLPDGSSMEYQYDGSPLRDDVKLTRVTHVGSAGGRINCSYTYSGGLMTRFTDHEGNTYRADYDSDARCTRMEDPVQKVVTLNYSSNGSRTDTAVYNERGIGRQLLYTERDWFDGWFGNCMKSVDAEGNVTEYAYRDNLLQMTTTQDSCQTISEGAVAFSTVGKYEITTYDENENPSRTRTSESVTTYESNTNGDITSEVTVNSDGNESVREKSEYDEDGDVIWTYDFIEDEGEFDTYHDEDSDFEGEPDTEYVVSENVTSESEINSSNLISKTEYSYAWLDGGGRRTTETVTEDGVVTQTVTEVDAMGRELLQETRTGNSITSSTRNTYDEFGRNISTAVTSTRGDSTSTRTTSRSYDNNGTVVSETSEDGTVTSYSYDAVNRVVRENVTNGDYSRVTLTGYAYSDTDVSAGDGVLHTVENAYVTTRSVQGGDTVVTWQNGAGNTVKKYENGLYVHSTFDRSGHEVCTYQAGINDSPTGGMLTLNLHDSAGNNTATIQGAVFADGAYRITDDSIVTRTEHDGNGNAVRITDENGNRTLMTYDEKNQLTSLTQPGGQRSLFSYSEDGNGGSQIEAVYAGGARTVTRSSERGLETETTDYLGDSPGIRIQKSHDAEGNITREEELSGNYRTYSYNEEGKVTRKKSYDAQGSLTLETEYGYNGDSRLILQQDWQISGDNRTLASSVRYTYDSAGRKASFKEWHGESEPQQPTGSYSYDSEDRVVQIDYSTDSEVSRVNYLYNQNGWLSEIKVNGHASREYDYDRFGRVVQMTDHAVSGSAEITRNYQYDQYSRVTSMEYTKHGESEPFERYSYIYDKAGNITEESVVTSHGEAGQNIHRIREYAYNSNGWLVEVSDSSTSDDLSDSAAQPVITTYGYDDAGNRISRDISGEVTTSQYNQLNQLVSSETVDGSEVVVSEVSYSYDSNGNLTLQNDAVTGESTAMSYDAENRMIGLTRSQNGTEVLQQTNAYNGDGQRIRKTESGSGLTQSQTERDYFYQDGTVLYTGDANSQNDFNVIGTEGNITASSRITGNDEEWYIYSRDIRGSVTSIHDNSENLVAEYDFDEFGNTSILLEDGIENEFGYTGQIYDRNTGLYYYNARFYDSETGRFTSQDTYRGEQKDADTYHLYAYCANNPINYVDPTGHFVWVLPAAFAVLTTTELAAYFAGICSVLAGIAVGLNLAKIKKAWSINSDSIKSMLLGIKISINKGKLKRKSQKQHKHHIVAKRAARAKTARKVLYRHGIGINSQSNLVRLKENLHRYLHRKAYYEGVNSVICASQIMINVLHVKYPYLIPSNKMKEYKKATCKAALGGLKGLLKGANLCVN